MNACPHCGDTSFGYEYRVPCVDLRVGQWGCSSESAEISNGALPKTVVCQNCKKRVDLKKAEGMEP